MSKLETIKTFFKRLWRGFRGFKWWQQIIVLLGSFLLIVLFFDWILMPFYTRHGEEYELPDVTEKHIEEARTLLEKKDFIPIIHDSVFHAYYPAGTVIRQNPISYSTVKKGRRVYLVLSSGEKPIYMPDLVTETLTNARLKLREAGLELDETIWDFSEEYPYREIVINQSIAPEELVKNSQKITITVSLGPHPTKMEVPLLVGKSLRRALKELEAIGILGEQVVVKTRYQPNLVPQTIIKQSVGEGTLAGDVDVIELAVSTDRLPEPGEKDDDGN